MLPASGIMVFETENRPETRSTQIWPAGRRASASASRWQPPRPSGDASSPWPDASPARPAVSHCIFPEAGPGRTSSAAPWPDCALCRSLPDVAVDLRPAALPWAVAQSRASPVRRCPSCRPPGHFRPSSPLQAATSPLPWPQPRSSESGRAHSTSLPRTPSSQRSHHIPSVDSGLRYLNALEPGDTATMVAG